jgi:hypothetical protein
MFFVFFLGGGQSLLLAPQSRQTRTVPFFLMTSTGDVLVGRDGALLDEDADFDRCPFPIKSDDKTNPQRARRTKPFRLF